MGQSKPATMTIRKYRTARAARCPANTASRGARSPSEREVLQMQDAMRKEKPAQNEQATDEELFEVLIAISVVAKQLARRVMMKGDNHEQNERTGHHAG